MQVTLNDRAMLKISGSDSELFLQNQLSNDITKLDNSTAQLNAYCQHQGKIIALFWVMRYEGSLLLSFPIDLVEKIHSRLQMFVIMSDVVIQDVSNEFCQIGLINETNENAFNIKDQLSVLLKKDNNVAAVIDAESIDIWHKACIDSLLPEIYLLTSEKLVPQMLNLDINEFGVNFSKGCYPGQEVVARLHYLGSAKRRLFAFESNTEINIGDSLYCASSKSAKDRGDRYKGSGMVVFRIKYKSKFYCLSTLEIELQDEAVTLNNENGPKLTRIQK
ncbi:folate-binding protein YgfZ [Candidatus Thioglobus sp.]|nr:folate-binding protein YgfZ [Candidatus Thioglobus sp.]